MLHGQLNSNPPFASTPDFYGRHPPLTLNPHAHFKPQHLTSTLHLNSHSIMTHPLPRRAENVTFVYAADGVMELARPVYVKLNHSIAKYVKVRFKMAARWMMISEVSFDTREF